MIFKKPNHLYFNSCSIYPDTNVFMHSIVRLEINVFCFSSYFMKTDGKMKDLWYILHCVRVYERLCQCFCECAWDKIYMCRRNSPAPPQPSRLHRLCGSIASESGWIINAHILFFTDGEIIWDGFSSSSQWIHQLFKVSIFSFFFFQISPCRRGAVIGSRDIVTLLLRPWAWYLTQRASIHIHP